MKLQKIVFLIRNRKYDTIIKKIKSRLSNNPGIEVKESAKLAHGAPEKLNESNMEDNDIISIIIPSYNHGNYIEKSIISVVNQRNVKKELIIIDDNSQDNSMSIIQNITARNTVKSAFVNEIKIISHHINKGASNSINEGINIANGTFITILNSDDFYSEDRLEHMINRLKEEKADLIFSRCIAVDSKDYRIYSSFVKNKQKKQFKTEGLDIKDLLINNAAISTGNMVFNRNILSKAGLFCNLKYIHDWDFLLRVLMYGKVIVDNEAYYYYRVHKNNTFRLLDKSYALGDREAVSMYAYILDMLVNHKYTNKNLDKDYDDLIQILVQRISHLMIE